MTRFEPGRGKARPTTATSVAGNADVEQDDAADFTMQRSVSQLLFSYLPGKTVDWENGTSIVQLTSVRLASAWDPLRADLVLAEVSDYLQRWRAAGGRVHASFPEPRRDPGRFTVGEPKSIEADVLDTALQCLSCSRLVFLSRPQLARRDGAANPYTCPDPLCHGTLRQFPQVFVHGCGHLVTLSKWMPAMKQENGRWVETRYPLECKHCGAQGIPVIENTRSERAKDLIAVCRRCKSTISDGRVNARCPECVRALGRGQLPIATAWPGGPQDAASGADTDDDDTTARWQSTAVTQVMMRITSYRASEAYYPHTITTLRLDRPEVYYVPDVEVELLRQLAPDTAQEYQQDDLQAVLQHLFAQAGSANERGDLATVQKVTEQIGAVMRGQKPTADLPQTLAPLKNPPPDIIRGIKESRALKTQVGMRLYHAVLGDTPGGATAALLSTLEKQHEALGLRPTRLVEDLPVITATFGYTRRSFDALYEEYDGNLLPTQLRPFYALDNFAATQVGRASAEGTVPILAREGEHEGLFFSLDPERVLRWLARNGVVIPDDGRAPIARILDACEDVDRYYDHIWEQPVRRLVFGLVHSFSHAAMRRVSRSAGLERTSVSEYVFLPLLGTVVYANSSSFRMGSMESLLRSDFVECLESLNDQAVTCIFDPDCLDHRGACVGCLHAPEICCRVFNHGLSRAFLVGGHAPWEDASSAARVIGYWDE